MRRTISSRLLGTLRISAGKIDTGSSSFSMIDKRQRFQWLLVPAIIDLAKVTFYFSADILLTDIFILWINSRCFIYIYIYFVVASGKWQVISCQQTLLRAFTFVLSNVCARERSPSSSLMIILDIFSFLPLSLTQVPDCIFNDIYISPSCQLSSRVRQSQ